LKAGDQAVELPGLTDTVFLDNVGYWLDLQYQSDDTAIVNFIGIPGSMKIEPQFVLA
jgi:hypothetical protein